MSQDDERYTLHRASDNHERTFHWLLRFLHQILKLYLICLRENLLILALMPARAAERENPANVTFGELLQMIQSAKPTRRIEAVGLVVAATLAVVVSIGWSVSVLCARILGEVITTGAHETARIELADGTVLSLGAHSRARVNVTARNRIARLEGGEAMFSVAHDPTRPFFLRTFLANATISSGTKLRVTIDSSVEFEVYEGVALVRLRGAAAGAPVRRLQKGTPPFRVPVDGTLALAANSHGKAGLLKGEMAKRTPLFGGVVSCSYEPYTADPCEGAYGNENTPGLWHQLIDPSA